MSRTFADRDLLVWEAFASSGAFGLPDRARIVFNCLSDPGGRARYRVLDGNLSEAENLLASMEVERLRVLLEGAPPLD